MAAVCLINYGFAPVCVAPVWLYLEYP